MTDMNKDGQVNVKSEFDPNNIEVKTEQADYTSFDNNNDEVRKCFNLLKLLKDKLDRRHRFDPLGSEYRRSAPRRTETQQCQHHQCGNHQIINIFNWTDYPAAQPQQQVVNEPRWPNFPAVQSYRPETQWGQYQQYHQNAQPRWPEYNQSTVQFGNNAVYRPPAPTPAAVNEPFISINYVVPHAGYNEVTEVAVMRTSVVKEEIFEEPAEY